MKELVDDIWPAWQKIFFRFSCAFLFMLTLMAYNPVARFLWPTYHLQKPFFKNFTGLVNWLDKHIFHLGFLPAKHLISYGDTHFGVILTIFMLFVAFISTLAWTFLDIKRRNYSRLYYWFCNYLAYYMFLAMFLYTIFKIIPIQAPDLSIPELLTRWGDLRRWEVLFRFMGTSPLYCMFCGWLELTASVLLIFNRTRVVGGLLMLMIMVQVLCLNVFYNVDVIMSASVLLLADLFIIAPSLPKLYAIFILQKPVSLARHRYTFRTPWKKYALTLLCFLPLWNVFIVIKYTWNVHIQYVRNQQKERLYNVTVFEQGNDTVPPLTTDTTRWKYICFLDYSNGDKQMVKYNMLEKPVYYLCKWGSAGNKVTLTKPDDSTHKSVFDLKKYANGTMEMKGRILGKNITMQLTNMPVDSMTLRKDKFLFMQEDEY